MRDVTPEEARKSQVRTALRAIKMHADSFAPDAPQAATLKRISGLAAVALSTLDK